MSVLSSEISAYDEMRPDLEANHHGEWVVVRDRSLVGTYDDFQKAAQDAVHRFGRGPYLIRQIGAPPITLPASILYRPVNADG